mmetsp:Transcript_22457/g.62294  ORF Transcript_22457/g.62294 Transcript_22457/m.62294 type:complete len:212 (-) Transcript_22457:236-871(-)
MNSQVGAQRAVYVTGSPGIFWTAREYLRSRVSTDMPPPSIPRRYGSRSSIVQAGLSLKRASKRSPGFVGSLSASNRFTYSTPPLVSTRARPVSISVVGRSSFIGMDFTQASMKSEACQWGVCSRALAKHGHTLVGSRSHRDRLSPAGLPSCSIGSGVSSSRLLNAARQCATTAGSNPSRWSSDSAVPPGIAQAGQSFSTALSSRRCSKSAM